MAKIIPLAICHKCHKRILIGEPYTRFKRQAIYHESCFVEYIDEFDFTDFFVNGTMPENYEEEPIFANQDLVLSSSKEV